MKEEYIKKIIEDVKRNDLTEEEAFEKLKDLPYSELGFANIDHHRSIRTGFPEVIYCQGKSPEQIRDIFLELLRHSQRVFGTRATEKDYETVRAAIPKAKFYETAGIIAVTEDESFRSQDHEAPKATDRASVTVVSAGTADMPVAEEAAVTAELLGNRVSRVYDVGVAGIHRLFDNLDEIREADVVIAVAGMEGALASVVGGLVQAPVIAVPTSVGYGANLEGVSALLSMLNSCANGIAVVNIDNGFGAGYMASVINRVGRR